MSYIYRHLIAQSLSPPGTQRIVACNAAGEQVCTIPLGPLAPPAAQPLYSVGLFADIHLYPVAAVNWHPETKFRAALGHCQANGCKVVIVSGDLSQTGFYRERTLDDGSVEKYYDPVQMQEYKNIREEFDIPVWALMGNHESYCRNVTDSLDDVEDVIGIRALSYTISGGESTERNVHMDGLGSDMFILCGQPSPGFVMSDEDFQWLTEILADNAHRRCFLFIHSYIEEDAGDPADVRENSIFELWGAARKSEFMALLRQYPNVVLFHGHSHMKFCNQEHDAAANYSERNGFKSVHIPSLATPRDIDFENNKSVDDPNASEGYIVDVYPDGIHLRGWDFVADNPSPLGTMWIPVPEGGVTV